MMGEIQGSAVAEDLNNDGILEICAVDMKSNLACFDRHGKSFWETRISGYSSQSPRIGDVDGDGQLDLVVGTSTGHVWAVNGMTGEPLRDFPVKTNGSIFAPALLVNLNKTEEAEHMMGMPVTDSGVVHNDAGLHIVIPSNDGHLYIIDGKSLCVEKVDIGEHVYAQVLADDIDGNGNLDLLVGTMNGNMYAFQTNTPYHPLKTWSSQVQGLNGMTAREGHVGIYVLKASRQHRDVVGNNFKIMFEIVDHRGHRQKHGHGKTPDKRYHVGIYVGKAMIVLNRHYYQPGVVTEIVKCPPTRMYATVYVRMRTESAREYSDSYSLSFNMYFFNSIKWVVLIPFFVIGFSMLYMKKSADSILPMHGGLHADVPEDTDDWESDEELYEEFEGQRGVGAQGGGKYF
eukprot:TRINITY_DN532_c2_g1_i4.p1 TRINITY_DN532_c2_g1~~TRINITY_DN532_c2_g1_i4.p1  ORF type:complete len:401 (+),score=117.53 TRINITY_DN532_c2_g1_i4:1206-2408(+)